MAFAEQQEMSGLPAPGRASAQASWLSAMMVFGPLSLLAEFLIARTHHRPLGAATFASAAVVLWLFAEVTSRRTLDATVCNVRARNRKIAWVISSAVTVGVLLRLFL